MTEDEIRALYLEELINIAPDLEIGSVGPDDHIQDDLELDSMDVLNLIAALHARTGVSVPERDYPEVATATKAVAYLSRALA